MKTGKLWHPLWGASFLGLRQDRRLSNLEKYVADTSIVYLHHIVEEDTRVHVRIRVSFDSLCARGQ